MASASLATAAQNLITLRICLATAAARAGRDSTAVRLIAVSKMQPVVMLAGQTELGESHLQKAIAKIESLRKYVDIVWHFIAAMWQNTSADFHA